MVKDSTMDGCNGSTPEGQQGKIRSTMCWLRATAVSRWSWGTYLIHRYWLLSFGGLILLLAICIQYVLPHWSVYSVQFLQENLLVVGTVVLLLLFLFLWKVPKWQVANIKEDKDRLATESGFRQTFVQIVGGAALLGGLYFTAQTLRTTQEGQITDRFTKAIAQLGDEKNRAVRLGGIYALERIAKDSETDYWSVMEVLTAFVRETVSIKNIQDTLPPGRTDCLSVKEVFTDLIQERGTVKNVQDTQPSEQNEGHKGEEELELRADIQAILTVLGRRTRAYGTGETQPLNLRKTQLQTASLRRAQLQRANLCGAQLQGANLWLAQLQKANLDMAQLQGADLSNAQLQQARLYGTQLQETKLSKAQLHAADCYRIKLQDANLDRARLQYASLHEAQLQGAKLSKAQLQNAYLAGANLQGTDLKGAELTNVRNLTQDQIDAACVDDDTTLPESLKKPPPCPANP